MHVDSPSRVVTPTFKPQAAKLNPQVSALVQLAAQMQVVRRDTSLSEAEKEAQLELLGNQSKAIEQNVKDKSEREKTAKLDTATNAGTAVQTNKSTAGATVGPSSSASTVVATDPAAPVTDAPAAGALPAAPQGSTGTFVDAYA